MDLLRAFVRRYNIIARELRSYTSLKRQGGRVMRKFIRRKVEAWLILLAAKVLMGRNVERAMVTSRRDNNDMWGMAERLEAVALRISTNYTKGLEGYDPARPTPPRR